MEDSSWTGEGVVNSILDRIRTTARVELVYGEERKVADKTIIPIAAVAYTFGGGGGGTGPSHNGRSNGHAEEAHVGTGGGGGGAVRVLPVGVLEVTEDETRIVPVFDWTRIVTTALTVFGIWMVFRTIFRKR